MDTDKFTVADDTGNTAIAGTLTTTGATALNGGLDVTGVGVFSVGFISGSSSVTATSMGTGTGVIAYGVSFASVSSSNSNYLVTLPSSEGSSSTCSTGHTIKLYSANGYMIQTSAPASISLQGTVGSSCASSVGSTLLVECTCTTSTSYVCTTISSTGDVSGLSAPSCSRRRSLLNELVF